MISTPYAFLPLTLLLFVLAACDREELRDRPAGLLAPFPSTPDGRPVEEAERTPRTIEQAVALVTKLAPPEAPERRAERLRDLRDEPIIVLGAEGAVGIAAAWPALEPGRFTLRPPTRAELTFTQLGKLSADAPPEAFAAAHAFLAREAIRPRPAPQRFTDAVLIVAAADSSADDARALGTLLVRDGAARFARLAVLGQGGLWGALPLPPATRPLPALLAPQRPAPPARPSPPPLDPEVAAKLHEALARPIPGPRCLVVEAGPSLGARVTQALQGAGPDDVVAVDAAFTLQEQVDPARVVGAGAARRVRLGDRCD